MDRVLTVWDYYDGPRTGIAEYGGTPHYFSCAWDSAADDYSSSFDLLPIDEPTLSFALEQWHIWRAWESDFHAGRVLLDTHPAFGGKSARYDELQRMLNAAIAQLPPATIQSSPTFSSASDSSDFPPGVMRSLLVAWSNAA